MPVTHTTTVRNIGGVGSRNSYYLVTGTGNTPGDFPVDARTTIDTENQVLTITGADVLIDGEWDDTGWTITLPSEAMVSATDNATWTSGVNQNGQFVRGANWRIPNPPSNAYSVFANAATGRQSSSCNAQWFGITFDMVDVDTTITTADRKFWNERNTNSASNLTYTLSNHELNAGGFAYLGTNTGTVGTYDVTLINMFYRIFNVGGLPALDALSMNGDSSTNAGDAGRVRILMDLSGTNNIDITGFSPRTSATGFVRVGGALGSNDLRLLHTTVEPRRVVMNRGGGNVVRAVTTADFNANIVDLAGTGLSGRIFASTVPRTSVNINTLDTALTTLPDETVGTAQNPLDDADTPVAIPSWGVVSGAGTQRLLVSTRTATGPGSPTNYYYGNLTDYRFFTFTARAYGRQSVNVTTDQSTNFSQPIALNFALPAVPTASVTEATARALTDIANTDELVGAIRVFEADNNMDLITVTGSSVDFGDRVVLRNPGQTANVTVSGNTITVRASAAIPAGTVTNTMVTTGTFAAATFAAGVVIQDAAGPQITVRNSPAGVRTQFYDTTGGTNPALPFHEVTADTVFNRTLPAFSPSISNVRIVSYGPGFAARIQNVTLTTAPVDVDLSTLVPIPYPSTALSAQGIGFLSTDSSPRIYISAANIDIPNMRVTYSVDGDQTGLTDSQLNDWIQRAVRGRSDYGNIISMTQSDSIGSTGATGFATASSDRIRFTPGMVNNASFSLGHLGNTSGTTSLFQVSRDLTLQGGGTTTVTVQFAGSPSVFDAGAIDVSIANAGLATVDDVRTVAQTEGVSLNAAGRRQVGQQVGALA